MDDLPKANFLLGSYFSMGFQEEAFVDAATEEGGNYYIATEKIRQRKDPGQWQWDPSEAKLSLLKSVYSLAEYGRKKRV